ncbi:hypothetical protein [Lysinibacillus sphaericus]|uniref:hypothetical protein n=1 Tax=Lysinibacillus sphaericus TaxID=1421 RepID=UPI003D732684
MPEIELEPLFPEVFISYLLPTVTLVPLFPIFNLILEGNLYAFSKSISHLCIPPSK